MAKCSPGCTCGRHKGKPGYRFSDKSKEKLRKAARRQWSDPESRQKLVDAAKARSNSDEMARRANMGWNNPEVRAKYIESAKARSDSETMREKGAKAKRSQFSYPEQLIAEALTKLGYLYNRQVRIHRYFADFVIPGMNIVIEVNGDYWHNLPGAAEYDMKKDEIMASKGFDVIRIWESDIKQDPILALQNGLVRVNKL